MDCVVAPVLQVFPVALDDVSVTLPPAQTVVGPLAEIVGVAGAGLTVTVVEAQDVNVPQLVFAAKYVVVVVGETVIDEPVPIKVPPHEPVNHCVEATPPVAVRVVFEPLQIVVVPEILVGAANVVPVIEPIVIN